MLSLKRFKCLLMVAFFVVPTFVLSAEFTENDEQVVKAYLAYYGRAPDSGGFNFWSNALDIHEGNLSIILDDFGNSEEFDLRFGSYSNEELIINLYQQIFGRIPEYEGLLFFTSALDRRAQTLQNIAMDIINGAQNEDLVYVNLLVAEAKELLVPSQTNTSSESSAARFLTQVTFGVTTEEIDHLLGLNNYESWIDEQFSISSSLLLPGTHALYQALYDHCIQVEQECHAPLDEIRTLGELGYVDTEVHQFRYVWWANVIDGDDQLRQRIAFALSEILVISDIPLQLRRSQFGVADYYDTLLSHSFGNYRELLEAVTLHPVMGLYLGHIQNEKADPERNIRPDENFAREILQLFSIGVHQLKIDGTLIKDNDGKAIATYGQAEIQEFAKVFTGWNFANLDWGRDYSNGDRTMPMEPNEAYHDYGEKKLFNNVILPAGQTARQDLDAALDNIFEHPNVGPFISKNLIQRLVTSNPTPGYVARVAAIFNNNGSGIRGDMKAVIKAILLDTEARNGYTEIANFGKMREPVLRVSHLWRAFNVTKTNNSYFEWEVPPGYPVYSFLGLQNIAQQALRSPSVFNFFQSSYSPSGPVRDAELVAPEFQIATENIVMRTTNTLNSIIQTSQPNDPRYSYLDLQKEIDISTNLNSLLDHLDLLLLSGSMSESLRAIIYTHITTADFSDGIEGMDARVRDAISLIVNSPEYLIQR